LRRRREGDTRAPEQSRTTHGTNRRHCRELLLRMARDLEGDLPAADRRALRRHLAGCERCGGFSRDLARTVALCRELGTAGMSAHARRRARANIARLLGRSRS
jgi:anti-sigma factor RsiW